MSCWLLVSLQFVHFNWCIHVIHGKDQKLTFSLNAALTHFTLSYKVLIRFNEFKFLHWKKLKNQEEKLYVNTLCRNDYEKIHFCISKRHLTTFVMFQANPDLQSSAVKCERYLAESRRWTSAGAVTACLQSLSTISSTDIIRYHHVIKARY